MVDTVTLNLKMSLFDLGNAPPSNNYVSQDKLKPKKSYPLIAVCSNCWSN